ncbi:MAG: glycosyltransferase family 39 protein, partial [Chloroflexi bacterium]|nr:glycosyltransferase family 39 protein [Chloroflexota bacterium]
SRIPAVLFSIAIVWMVWHWRRYLGKWGALITAFLLVISPYMLYYGRYVRNESFVGFSGVVMLYAILRHLEVGGKKYLYILAAALMLHFTAKETSFIYTAQALLYLVVYFIIQVSRTPWRGATRDYRSFIISLCVTILLAGVTVGYGLYTRDMETITSTETAIPANPDAAPLPPSGPAISPLTFALAIAAVIALVVTAYFLIRGYTWERLRTNRSFELLMIAGTIVLPQLSPFLINLTDVTIPTTGPEVRALAGDWRAILTIGACLLATFLIATAIGIIWNPSKWWKTSLVFWVPYTILYTTVFTNPNGFFTGAIGSLGYWLVQQGVERGSQPWYYYLLVQIPIYEFLPALGLILALILGFRRKVSLPLEWEVDMIDGTFDGNWESTAQPTPEQQETYTRELNFVNMFSLLVWWSISSFLAFTIAGERMPWLTYHIALPMILITGWALGYIIDNTNWEALKEKKIVLGIVATTIFIVSAANLVYAWSSPARPFQGVALEQLQATNLFLLPLFVSILSLIASGFFLREWSFKDIRHVFTLVIFAFLSIFTVRAS